MAIIIDNYRVIEKFYSKKNDVFKVTAAKKPGCGEFFVLKIFRGTGMEKRKELEAGILKMLSESKLAAPRLLEEGRDFIVMEYIGGRTFLEILEEAEKSDMDIATEGSFEEIFCQVFDFILSFGRVTSAAGKKTLELGDMNLRNFIFNKKIYRVDFEECSEGSAQKDLGKLLAFILAYNPVLSRFKIKLVKSMLEVLESRYIISKEKLIYFINEELGNIEKRRNLRLPLYPSFY